MDTDCKNELIDLKFDYAHFKGEAIFAAGASGLILLRRLGRAKPRCLKFCVGLEKIFAGLFLARWTERLCAGLAFHLYQARQFCLKIKALKTTCFMRPRFAAQG